MIGSHSRRSSLASRRGLSYLEVLIAAAIGLVGMLGAIALFPVASLQLQRGLEADTGNAVGEAAIHQTETYGAGNPRNWSFYSPAAPAPPVAITDWSPVELPVSNTLATYAHPGDAAPFQFRYQEYGNRSWNYNVKRLSSFCLDSRMIAEMMYQVGAPATVAQTNNMSYWRFPYVPEVNANDPRMHRISLISPFTNAPLSIQQARLRFKSADDLIFNREAKDAFGPLPAAQVLMPNNTRRDYFAEYEWIVTLVPKFNGNPDPNLPPGINGIQSNLVQSGEYVLSVVVFHSRRARLDTILVNQANENFVEDERVCDVVSFLGNGIGGGDVLIRSRVHALTSKHHDADTFARENDWVMLGRTAKIFDATGNPIIDPVSGTQVVTAPIFQWYRVTGVQGDPTALDNTSNPIASTTGPYFRYLTLQGADWFMNDLNDPTLNTNLGQADPNSKIPLASMSLVSGVVGVFERTIRLDTGDLW